MDLSTFVQDWGLVVAAISAGAAVLLALRLRDPGFRLRVDHAVLRLPLVGNLVRKIETERFARLLGGLVAATAPLLLATPSEAGELRVEVEGIRSTTGTILVGLYDSAVGFNRAIEGCDKGGFLNDPDRVAGVALKANAARTAAVTFGNIEPGRYAIILLHDENGNARLDRNGWGVPSEPYGFSNDARGFLGPPSFAAAAMTLDGGDRTAVVTLVFHGSGAPTDAVSSVDDLPDGF
jgi:uncharacterized protein (DUF2141 family)